MAATRDNSTASGADHLAPSQPTPVVAHVVTHADDLNIDLSPRQISSIQVEQGGTIHVHFMPENARITADNHPQEDMIFHMLDHDENAPTSGLHEDDFVPVDDTGSEDAPLLGNQPSAAQTGWLAWAANGAQKAALSVKNAALYAKKHPASSFMAVATAAPPALNALAAPTHQSPEVISSTWWNNLSTVTQAHAIANSASSLTVNTIMNALFLPIAATKFKKNIRHTFDNPTKFVENTVSILFGMGAALASGMISYNAFLWLPAARITASIPAILSFLAAFASRYVGVHHSLTRLLHQFNDDIRVQKEFVDKLSHINPTLREQPKAEEENTPTLLERLKAEVDVIIQDIRANAGNPDQETVLTQDQMQSLIQQLADKLQAFSNLHPDLVQQKTTSEYVKHYAGMVFDLTFALAALAPASFLTHMQKGYDGVNLLTMNQLTDTNVWTKRAIGAIPGSASAMLYGICGIDIRTTLTEMATYLYQHPKDIPFAILLLAANGFSASGMQNVAEGIASKKTNIIGFNAEDQAALSTTFVVLTALGGGMTNTNSTIKKAFLSTPALTFKNANYDTIVHYLSKVHDHPIEHDTADHLRQLKLFSPPPRTRSENQLDALTRSEYSLGV